MASNSTVGHGLRIRHGTPARRARSAATGTAPGGRRVLTEVLVVAVYDDNGG